MDWVFVWITATQYLFDSKCLRIHLRSVFVLIAIRILYKTTKHMAFIELAVNKRLKMLKEAAPCNTTTTTIVNMLHGNPSRYQFFQEFSLLAFSLCSSLWSFGEYTTRQKSCHQLNYWKGIHVKQFLMMWLKVWILLTILFSAEWYVHSKCVFLFFFSVISTSIVAAILRFLFRHTLYIVVIFIVFFTFACIQRTFAIRSFFIILNFDWHYF